MLHLGIHFWLVGKIIVFGRRRQQFTKALEKWEAITLNQSIFERNYIQLKLQASPDKLITTVHSDSQRFFLCLFFFFKINSNCWMHWISNAITNTCFFVNLKIMNKHVDSKRGRTNENWKPMSFLCQAENNYLGVLNEVLLTC